jgi:hypothetical protein
MFGQAPFCKVPFCTTTTDILFDIATINANAEFVVDGYIYGNKWTPTIIGDNTWIDATVETNVWTDSNVGDNTWNQIG